MGIFISTPRYANSIYKLDSCYLKEYIHVRLKDSIDSKTLKTITDEKNLRSCNKPTPILMEDGSFWLIIHT